MNRFFPEMKKNFGFGCMRLPVNGDEIDTAAFCVSNYNLSPGLQKIPRPIGRGISHFKRNYFAAPAT